MAKIGVRFAINQVPLCVRVRSRVWRVGDVVSRETIEHDERSVPLRYIRP